MKEKGIVMKEHHVLFYFNVFSKDFLEYFVGLSIFKIEY
jgi:hypothetical protein